MEQETPTQRYKRRITQQSQCYSLEVTKHIPIISHVCIEYENHKFFINTQKLLQTYGRKWIICKKTFKAGIMDRAANMKERTELSDEEEPNEEERQHTQVQRRLYFNGDCAELPRDHPEIGSLLMKYVCAGFFFPYFIIGL
ncbi:unnamed protein product [Cuscuta epithymum]|uniref:Uncharacterized protein n=1 Tax=Cuscuta epithymum TaxID=186058 RepID=A0AAV0DS21_9ASTE|nr:unnamed protein product [Cuscuta epithymum]